MLGVPFALGAWIIWMVQRRFVASRRLVGLVENRRRCATRALGLARSRMVRSGIK